MDLLQSSGPIALNELSMRSSEAPEEFLRRLEKLKQDGVIVIKGPKSENLLELTPEEIPQLSNTVVELSWSGLKRSFAS